MRSILITNDDGIRADGLIRLAGAASRFGEVWVIAPEVQRSAASQSITLNSTIDVFPTDFPVEGVRAFSCSGTPADCVRLACLTLMPRRPDLVLAGINYGCNAATDIQYSATAGAAFEAAFQGVPAIALSEKSGGCHEVTDAFLETVLERLIGRDPGAGQIWNVNFPGCRLADCRGILEDRKVSTGTFYHDHYRVVEELAGQGLRLEAVGQYNEDAEEETDMRAIVDGYVSIGTVNNIGYAPVRCRRRSL